MRGRRIILLVEPDDGIRVTFRVVLRREGFEVLEATNTTEALEQLREARPELVITGTGIPKGSGSELIRTLRTEADHGGTRVLALGPDASRAEATSAGADAFQGVPVRPDQLVKLVTQLIGRA